MKSQTRNIVSIPHLYVLGLDGIANLLLAATYRWSRVLMHPAPVLFHRFQIPKLFVADVALEGF